MKNAGPFKVEKRRKNQEQKITNPTRVHRKKKSKKQQQNDGQQPPNMNEPNN